MRVDFNYRRDQGGKKRPLATAEGIWGVRAWEGSNCCVIRFTKRSSSAADWFSIAFCSSLSFSSAYGMRFGTAAIDVITVFPKTKEKKRKKQDMWIDTYHSLLYNSALFAVSVLPAVVSGLLQAHLAFVSTEAEDQQHSWNA